MDVPAPTRLALRWHGGKWRLAPWVIAHFPAHRIYVEPFGGAASVLLRKPRSYAEVYDDLDGDLVNVFRVLRDPAQAARLIALLELTPFAREEFLLAYEPAACPVERARRMIARSFFGYGTTSRRASATGFRAKAYRQNQTGPQDWASHAQTLHAVTQRLRGVTIENRPALDVMRHQDSPDTLHYCDPPYLPETRTKFARDRAYACEMSLEDHEALLAGLNALEGMVVLSGYPSPLYENALQGWRRVETQALADGAAKRTEVLWMNPACAAAAPGPLFAPDTPAAQPPQARPRARSEARTDRADAREDRNSG